MPWNDAVVCAACGTTLRPLTYPVPPDDDPPGEARPSLKCTGCDQGYRWRDSAGWGPSDSP
jgi:hypothetical protein